MAGQEHEQSRVVRSLTSREGVAAVASAVVVGIAWGAFCWLHRSAGWPGVIVPTIYVAAVTVVVACPTLVWLRARRWIEPAARAPAAVVLVAAVAVALVAMHVWRWTVPLEEVRRRTHEIVIGPTLLGVASVPMLARAIEGGRCSRSALRDILVSAGGFSLVAMYFWWGGP